MKFAPLEIDFSTVDTLVLFASYEERCLSIAKEAANANFAGNVLIYFRDDISDQGSKSISRKCSRFLIHVKLRQFNTLHRFR